MSKAVLPPYSFDYGDSSPAQTARVMLSWCKAKTAHDPVTLTILGVLAGAFIALGCVLFTTVMVGVPSWLGPMRLIAGMAFALGLLLVCTTGAELSTGNCLLVAAWHRKEVQLGDALRIIGLSFPANAAGALLIALLMGETGLLAGRHGRALVAIAEAKMALTPSQAFTRAILCNALVVLAVWMALAGRTLPSKFIGVVLPIGAFVACGFEHSIANVYFLPAARLAGSTAALSDAALNIVVVTAGNLVGGVAVAMALVVAHFPARRFVPEDHQRKRPGFVWRKAA